MLWQAAGFSEKDSLIITVITGLVNIVTTARRDRFDRPLRPQAAADHRLDRHGLTLGTLTVIFGTATLKAASPCDRHRQAGCAARRQRVRVCVRDVMGSGRVGAAGGVVPEPDPCRRAVGGGRRAVDRQLDRFYSFPPLKDAGLGLAYGILTTFAVLSLLFVLRFIRETKGVELEDMPGGEPVEST